MARRIEIPTGVFRYFLSCRVEYTDYQFFSFDQIVAIIEGELYIEACVAVTVLELCGDFVICHKDAWYIVQVYVAENA